MEDEDEPRGPIAALRARSGVIFGVIGLAAWLVMVWFMFKDVL
ncbi:MULTISPECIES: hypothetical protein [Sphingobium]|nr:MULTISPECIES: hypothetical protein [Sphingobium]